MIILSDLGNPARIQAELTHLCVPVVANVFQAPSGYACASHTTWDPLGKVTGGDNRACRHPGPFAGQPPVDVDQ